MPPSIEQFTVRRFEIAAGMLALLLIGGCSSSYRKHPSDDATVTTTDGAEIPAADGGDASWEVLNPYDASDSNDEPSSTQLEPCVHDSDCSASGPCYRSYCNRAGSCEPIISTDGTSCHSTAVIDGICLNGSCQESRCGDGYLDQNRSEHCDDGNSDNTDECVECDEARCGDGYVQTGVEMCEPRGDRFCKEDCTPAVCGDGVIDEPMENCEPDSATGPCDQYCRISDTPEWLVEVQPPNMVSNPVGISPLSSLTLLLDSEGNPIVIYMATYEIGSPLRATVPRVDKYDAAGQSIWSWTGGAFVSFYGATLDSKDNVILAGYSADPEGPWLLKLDKNGIEQWSAIGSDPEEVFAGVSSDEQANLAVMSTSIKSTASGDYLYPWYTSDLRFEFFDSDGTRHPDERLAVDGAYISGESMSSGVIEGARRMLLAGATLVDDGVEPRLVLLAPDAAEVWDAPASYSSSTQEDGFLKAVATNEGDIFVLGGSNLEEGEFFFTSFWLDRFSADGTARWSEAKPLRDNTVAFFHTAGGLAPHQLHFPMALDSEGNVYLAPHGTDDERRLMLIDKYGPDGSPTWERPIFFDSGYVASNGSSETNYAVGLAVDDKGAIYALSTGVFVPTPPMPMAVPALVDGLWLHKWTPPD